MGEVPAVSDEVIALVEGANAQWMATGHDGVPEAARVMGARFGADRSSLTIFVPTEQAGHAFDDLRASPRVAIFFTCVTDYRAVQIKGEVVAIRAATEDERQLQERYLRAFTDECAKIGLDAQATSLMVCWPSAAIEVKVSDLFVQTPGPKAGHRWP